MDRTDSKSDTPLTQKRSWIVRDNNDVAWGPFSAANEARAWAQKKWSAIPEYSDHDGGGYWEIESVLEPTP